jgi:hypothetical protein
VKIRNMNNTLFDQCLSIFDIYKYITNQVLHNYFTWSIHHVKKDLHFRYINHLGKKIFYPLTSVKQLYKQKKISLPSFNILTSFGPTICLTLSEIIILNELVCQYGLNHHLYGKFQKTNDWTINSPDHDNKAWMCQMKTSYIE